MASSELSVRVVCRDALRLRGDASDGFDAVLEACEALSAQRPNATWGVDAFLAPGDDEAGRTRRLVWMNKDTGYALVMLVAAAGLFVAFFTLEVVCLQSTLLAAAQGHVIKAQKYFQRGLRRSWQSTVEVFSHGGEKMTYVMPMSVRSSSRLGCFPDWTPAEKANAWTTIAQLASAQMTPDVHRTRRRMWTRHHVKQELDIVAFRQQLFAAKTVSGQVRVHIHRSGVCRERVQVLVGTGDLKQSCFMAKAGVDYLSKQEVVVFEPGQTKALFEVELLQRKVKWSTTCFFVVTLKCVPTNNALLGGPGIAVWATEDDTGVEARVAILQDNTFPGNIPQHRMDSPSGLWLMYYYIKELAQERGKRYWKTMLGKMYDPLHNVLVTVYVRKLLLDWAIPPSNGGTRDRILMLVCIQLFSLFLLRWGDYAQAQFRGRTSGVRMVHRRQLLQKLMMIDHKTAYEVAGPEWFYTALENVEVATINGYWQSFELVQNSFALLLCLVSTLLDPLSGWKITTETAFPAVGIITAVPICVWMVFRRRQALAALLEERMEGEKTWVSTFAWLARASGSLYSFGGRELSYIERIFGEQSSKFIDVNHVTTQVTNDSFWVTRWMGAAGYILVMLWGAFRLMDELAAGTSDFTTGDYVLLLSVYLQFGRYLNAVNDCLVRIQVAAVSVRRIAQLLNLPEKRSLLAEDEVTPEFLAPNCIELRGVKFEVEADHPGLGAMGRITTPISLKIPLGRLVTVHGGNEASRMCFMALIAHVLQPSEGEVLCPRHAWAVMMPAMPVELPAGLTVQGCISLAGAPAIIAHSLAQILELRPERPVELLAPGDLQLLAIARAMLRDPEVLVLIRPFAYVASRKRQRLAELLRAWQTGGAERIVECLLRQQGRHLNVLEERARPRPRTLVLAGVNIPGGRMPGDCSKDVRISLSEVGDSSPHAASAPACSLSFGDVMMQEEP